MHAFLTQGPYIHALHIRHGPGVHYDQRALGSKLLTSQDIHRMREDRKVNWRKVQVYSWETNRLEDMMWKHLKLGDIVKIEWDEEFPADLLLLQAPDDIIYVDTM